MSAVLIYEESVEVPTGWSVVAMGFIREGDRSLDWRPDATHPEGYSRVWEDVRRSWWGTNVNQCDCVIRRDPKETP